MINYVDNNCNPQAIRLSTSSNDIIKKLGNENTAIDFQTAIFQKDINKLQKTLENLMIETISSFDTANETFYHGMLLGILSIVSSKYIILSNRESV